MTDEAKLNEAMARAIFFECMTIMHDHEKAWRKANQPIWRNMAERALAAINDSRTHWVAPHDFVSSEAMLAKLDECATEPPDPMGFVGFRGDSGNWNWLWSELRTAYLAKPAEEHAE